MVFLLDYLITRYTYVSYRVTSGIQILFCGTANVSISLNKDLFHLSLQSNQFYKVKNRSPMRSMMTLLYGFWWGGGSFQTCKTLNKIINKNQNNVKMFVYNIFIRAKHTVSWSWSCLHSLVSQNLYTALIFTVLKTQHWKYIIWLFS